nr:type VII secretion integral membrane protein EccD [Streptococcus thermophilus]
MVAASTHHVVRVTVRVSAVTYHRSIDVTLPTASTFAEVLPELARLIDLPEIGRSWEFTTAGGAPLDPHTPLHSMRVRDGQVLALRPEEQVEPPVVRDAAESLAAASAAGGPRAGIDTASSFAGLIAAGLLVSALTGPVIGLAAASLLSLAVGVISRSRAVFPAGAVLAGVTCGAWAGGEEALAWPLNSSAALGVIAASATVAVLIGGGAVLGLVGTRCGTALLTVSALSAGGALGSWLPSPQAPVATVVLLGLTAVMLMPAVATRGAGLRIPRVPTAGQEFSIADDYQDDVDVRARQARAITDGLGIGTAACMIPALVTVAVAGGGWIFAFCLCVAGALIVHASRHHSTAPRLSLAFSAVTAVACAVAAVARMDAPHPALLVLAGVVALAAASATIWARYVPGLEPTTLVWLERAEAAAIIAVMPLAVYLTGFFTLIRGL